MCSAYLNLDLNPLRQYGDGYGVTIRLHIGLEDVEDLIQDLQRAFEVKQSHLLVSDFTVTDNGRAGQGMSGTFERAS